MHRCINSIHSCLRYPLGIFSTSPRTHEAVPSPKQTRRRYCVYLYIHIYAYMHIYYTARVRYPLGSFSTSPRTHEAVPSPPQTSTRYCACCAPNATSASNGLVDCRSATPSTWKRGEGGWDVCICRYIHIIYVGRERDR